MEHIIYCMLYILPLTSCGTVPEFRSGRVDNTRTMEDKYDSALLGILQHEGKIERFLDAMLGFLYRRYLL